MLFRNLRAAELLSPGPGTHTFQPLASPLPTKEKQHPLPPTSTCFFPPPSLLHWELLSSSLAQRLSAQADRAASSSSGRECARCANTMRTSSCPCPNLGALPLHSRESFVGTQGQPELLKEVRLLSDRVSGQGPGEAGLHHHKERIFLRFRGNRSHLYVLTLESELGISQVHSVAHHPSCDWPFISLAPPWATGCQ